MTPETSIISSQSKGFTTPFWILEWQNFVQSQMTKPIEYNMTRPQRSFRYPAFAQLPPEANSHLLLFFKTLLSRRLQTQVEVFRSSSNAYCHLFKSLGKAHLKIGVLGPLLPERLHKAHASEWVWETLPRDPEEWENQTFSQYDVLVLSNPHTVDGFYYPQDFYSSLYHKLRTGSQNLVIVSEESLGIVSFNKVGPGSLKHFLKEDPNLFLLESVYPAKTPAGPEIAWLAHHNLPAPQSLELFESVELEQAVRAFLCFEQQEGNSFLEFHRRMLATKESLKVLSQVLKEALTQKLIEVPLWPDSGFHLVIDIQKVLKRDGFSDARAWALEVAKTHQILVNPGHFFGKPHCIQVCFAASPLYIEKFGALLRSALLKLE